MDLFTIEPGTWAALTLVVPDPPSTFHSPVYIYALDTEGQEDGQCRFAFYHADLPEGDGEPHKEFILKTRERTNRHWVAAILKPHTEKQLRLEKLTPGWLITRFPEQFGDHPPTFDVQEAMHKLYPHVE